MPKAKDGKPTPKEAEFIKAYTSKDKKTRLNGVQSAYKAYNTVDLKTADSIARDNLEKPRVMSRIEMALDNVGLTDDSVYPELQKIIHQDKHLSSKLGGINEYGKLKRYHDQASHNTGDVKVAFIINTSKE